MVKLVARESLVTPVPRVILELPDLLEPLVSLDLRYQIHLTHNPSDNFPKTRPGVGMPIHHQGISRVIAGSHSLTETLT